MSSNPDMIVIGGGAIGVCSTYYLAEAGAKVTLVDRDDVAAGTSYGNAGLIVPSHSIPLAAPGVWVQGLKWMLSPESPFYIKPRPSLDLVSWLWKFRAACTAAQRDRSMPVLRDLLLKSVELYDELAALDGLDFFYEKRGVLYLYKTEEAMHEGEEEAELLSHIGLEAEVLDRTQVEERLGGVTEPVMGGIHHAEDAHIAPALFVRNLAAKAREMGVTIVPGAEVTGFRTEAQTIKAVTTNNGELEAGQIVLAAGAWSPEIARPLGLRLPIQAAKGYSITHERPEGFPDMPFICSDNRVGVTPMGDTVRYAGTLELAGMDLSISQRRVDAIRRAPPTYLSLLEDHPMQEIEVWAGLRPVTPDGLALIGRTPRYANLVIAAGHAAIGVSSGPATGKLVSQIVTGDKPFMDIAPFNPARFG